MSTIGKVVVAMETQSAAFSKGIAQAQEGLESLGSTAGSVAGILAGALAFAGLEVGLSSMKEMVGRTIEATVSTERFARSLGISTQALQQLQGAGLLTAGLSADEFDGTLRKLTKTLGGAEEGNTKAGEALKALGLSAKDLAGLSVDQAFVKIGTAISGVADPVARAKAEVDLFGREGQKLGPMFEQGADGIQRAMQDTLRLGGALSDVDAEKVTQAHEQMERVSMAVQGVENQFAVALAPVLEAIAAKIVSLAPSVESMQSAFTSAFRGVAVGIGYAIDAYDVLNVAGQGVYYVLASGADLAFHVVEKLAEGIVWVANKFGAGIEMPAWVGTVEDGVDAWRKQVGEDTGKAAADLMNSAPAASRWGKFFDEVQAKSAETAAKIVTDHLAQKMAADFEEGGNKVAGILADLQKQVDQFGMSEAQKKVAEPKADGASAADITKATALQAQIDKMQDWKKEQEDANKLIEQSMTPIDKYQEQIDRVQKLFKDGLITAQQQADAIDKAQAQLAKDDKDGDGEAKGSAAVTRRFDFSLPQQPQVTSAAERAAAMAKDHLDQLKQLNVYQKPIYDYYNNPTIAVPDQIVTV